MEVALGGDLQVDQRVVGERGEQVVEEADAGGDRRRAGSVQVDGDGHGGFTGRTINGGSSGHGILLERVEMSRSFSAGDRTVNLK